MSCTLPKRVLEPLVCRWWRLDMLRLFDFRTEIGDVEFVTALSSSS